MIEVVFRFLANQVSGSGSRKGEVFLGFWEGGREKETIKQVTAR